MIIAYLSEWLYYYDQHNQRVHSFKSYKHHFIIKRLCSSSLLFSDQLLSAREKGDFRFFNIKLAPLALGFHVWWLISYFIFTIFTSFKRSNIARGAFSVLLFYWHSLKYIEKYCLAMAVQLDTVVTVNETKNSGSVNLIRCHLSPSTCHLVLNGGAAQTQF